MSKDKKRKRWRNAILGILGIIGAGYGVNVTVGPSGDEHQGDVARPSAECSCILRFGEVYELENGSSFRLSETETGITTMVIEPREN